MAYILPVDGPVSQPFGSSPGGFNPPGGHTGIDFGVGIGTPVRATAAGVVMHADWFRGSYADNPWWIKPTFAGIVVVIDHGSAISVYAHLNDTALNDGDRVAQGQIIGHSGNTRIENGETFAPHLHFEILPDGWDFQNGCYGRVNPMLYIGAANTAPEPHQPASEAVQSFQRVLGNDAGAYRKASSTNGALIEWFEPGHTYDFKGFVRGESVNGNNIWFVGKYSGGFAWSGAFTSQSTAGLADLTPAPAPNVMLAENERTTGTVAANLRTGASTSNPVMILPTVPDGQLKPDTTYVFKGWTRGQDVDGNNIWFISKSGGFAWSGAFTNKSVAGLPDMSPTPAKPAPSTPSEPPTPAPVVPTPVIVPSTFVKDVACVTRVRPAAEGHYQAGGFPARPAKIVIHQFDARAKDVHIDSAVGWFQSAANTGLTSAHFAVEGNEIDQVVKLSNRAYHAGKNGNDFIGIETHVGTNDALNKQTFDSVVRLIKEIAAKLGYMPELIDHRSVSSTSCGTDIDIPAYRAAVAKVAPVVPVPTPAPAPTPVVPPVSIPAPTEPTAKEFIDWLYGEFIKSRHN